MTIEQLRRYADLAGMEQRLRWIVVLVLALCVSAVEAIGALLIYVLLGFVTGVERALELPLVGDVERLLPPMSEERLLLWTAAAIAVFFVVRALVVLAKRYVESRVTEKAGARLSRRLARGYLTMPYEFHLGRNSAELIRNAYQTVNGLVKEVFQPLVKIVSEGLVVLGLLAVLVVTVPMATAMVVLVLGPATLLLLRVVYPRLKRLGRESQDLSRGSLKSLQQSLGGMRDIKVLGREEFFAEEFGRTRDRLARLRYRRDVLTELPIVGLETLLVVFIAGMFAVMVVLEGSAAAAIPVLGLFGYAVMRLKPSLNIIVKSVNQLRFAQAGIDDIATDIELFEQRPAISASEPPPLAFEREIELVGVHYRYPGSVVDALHAVDLRITKGESIGIVGATGGGKTTLVDVILGLLEPTAGSVKVDGVDIRDRARSWQRNIGVVPQSLFLVDDTLRRNIALGNSDDRIDEERVTQAVRMAQLEETVRALPDGLETVVGERGVRMSGGQRQRVAIARALYRQPEVLVFDEGTSALDNETEAELLRAIGTLRGDRTIVTVAHRLTTVRDCDRVVFVEAGRIVDVGPYEELLARNEAFRRLAGEPAPAPG